MRVFVDANKYIKLFEGRPSISYFEKLEKLVTEKKFTLVFPRITQEEVYRRVVQILKKECEEPKFTFPAIPEFIDEQEAIKKLKQIEDDGRKIWSAEYKKYITTKKDMAKRLFSTFRKLTVDYPDKDGEAYSLATKRKDKRFSPGKSNDPLGDQLVWELILKNCLDQDLVIVSADPDWQDKIDGEISKLNPFLLEEWRSKTVDKKIELFENLGDLIKRFEKDYKIPVEESEKAKQIPNPYSYPYSPISQNAGMQPLFGTAVAVASAYNPFEPLGPPSMGGSHMFVQSIHQCLECGRKTENEFAMCNDCLRRKGL
jgi:hypothetical protein